ncbi:hypothetical protein BH23BAC1_BH23BAC1_02170 [soil metagenome]
MMFRIIRNILLLFYIFLGACDPEGQRSETNYFNIDSLLTEQLQVLNSLDPTLQKIANIDGKLEERSLKLDSAGWAGELNIFFQSDINEPELAGRYEKKIFQENGEKIVSYVAREPKNVGIEYLKIIYSSGEIRKIESLFTEKNYLYLTRRKLSMDFEPGTTGIPILKGYLIDGKQKMILKDTINYHIQTNLIY